MRGGGDRAREGQAGRPGVAERFAVPRKPGNAGGGKGPQFKTNAIRSEGLGDWATYQLRRVFRNCRWRCTGLAAIVAGAAFMVGLAFRSGYSKLKLAGRLGAFGSRLRRRLW